MELSLLQYLSKFRPSTTCRKFSGKKMQSPGSTLGQPISVSLGVGSDSMSSGIGEPLPPELEERKEGCLSSWTGQCARTSSLNWALRFCALKSKHTWSFIECQLCARHAPGALYLLSQIIFPTTLPESFLFRWRNWIREFTWNSGKSPCLWTCHCKSSLVPSPVWVSLLSLPNLYLIHFPWLKASGFLWAEIPKTVPHCSPHGCPLSYLHY